MLRFASPRKGNEMNEKQIEPATENQTIEKEFNPTPGMRIWLDTAIELQTDVITEIADTCKMARQTWYDWHKVEGFEEWYYSEYKKKRRRWLPKLDAIGLKLASRDYNYWKDMKKIAGDDLDSKTPLIAIGAKADEMTIQIE